MESNEHETQDKKKFWILNDQLKAEIDQNGKLVNALLTRLSPFLEEGEEKENSCCEEEKALETEILKDFSIHLGKMQLCNTNIRKILEALVV